MHGGADSQKRIGAARTSHPASRQGGQLEKWGPAAPNVNLIYNIYGMIVP